MPVNLEPVEGVTLEQYGHACAWMTKGATKEDVIKALGIDMPKYDRAEAEWKTRMANDTSFTVTMKFSNAYTGAPPIPTGSGQRSGCERIEPEPRNIPV